MASMGSEIIGLDAGERGIISPSNRGGRRINSGRNPGGRSKKPSDNPISPPVVLTRAEEREQWRNVLAATDNNPKLKLEVLTRISEMRRGKPYTATNPRERRQPAADNKLMIAIQNLMPAPGSKRTSTIINANVKRGRGRPRKLKAKADTNE